MRRRANSLGDDHPRLALNAGSSKPFDPDSLAVCIVTYNRPKALDQAIRNWRDASPANTPIYVISNHSQIDIAPDNRQNVLLFENHLRPDDSSGYLTRSWNQAFLLGFRKHERVICSQDDVAVGPGYVEALQDSPPRDIYVAPQGDVCFCLNRTALSRVGWFDERFTRIGSHEVDYWFRCYKALGPERMSFVDTLHNWKVGDAEINGIGLEDYWRSTFRHGEEYLDWVAEGDDNLRHWLDKWGKAPKLEWAFAKRRIRLREIDWYPWFWKLIE